VAALHGGETLEQVTLEGDTDATVDCRGLFCFIGAQPATFEGEDVQGRLERRRRNWIADVILSEGGS